MAPPPGTIPPNERAALKPSPEGDVNRAGEILATTWVLSALIIIVIALRFWARTKLRIIGWDDWVMLLTGILNIATGIAETVSVTHGNGRHSYYLSDSQRVEAVKIGQYIAQPFAIMALATGKVSVGFLILRIVGPSTVWRRWAIYIIMSSTLIIAILTVLLLFFQCDPPKALWEGPVALPEANCWDASVFPDYAVFQGCFNGLMDIILAILPLTFVWRLQMPIRKKIYLSFLLGCGVLAGICAAVRTSKLYSLNERADVLWETYSLAAWTGAENFVVLICGSIPTLKPVYDVLATFCSSTLCRLSGGRYGAPPPASSHRSSSSEGIFLQKYDNKSKRRRRWPGAGGAGNGYRGLGGGGGVIDLNPGSTLTTCNRRGTNENELRKQTMQSHEWERKRRGKYGWFGSLGFGEGINVEREWKITRGSEERSGDGGKGGGGGEGEKSHTRLDDSDLDSTKGEADAKRPDGSSGDIV